ncbi:MAG: energy transducer TonB [Terriglobales bacterium]
MHYVGAVTVVVSLSDTGYVCGVEVVKGITDALDKQAVDAIRQQPFQPIRLDGKPTPGFMTIQRDFWRGDTSDIVVSQNADASPDEISPDARLVHAPDVAFLIGSGKVEGQRYWNQYFGVSFTAPRATFTAPSAVDDQGRNVRLVDAVAGTGNREDMYTISILADRLSNYPELKSRAEYVEGISGHLTREGAKRNRDTFPYVISGVDFVATILQESDSSDMSHFRGIFSTVMKGYVLSLDIAAPSEDQVLKIASSIEFKLGQ